MQQPGALLFVFGIVMSLSTSPARGGAADVPLHFIRLVELSVEKGCPFPQSFHSQGLKLWGKNLK